MKMEIKYLDATLDEAQALIDAESNTDKVRAIRKAIKGFRAGVGRNGTISMTGVRIIFNELDLIVGEG